MGSLSRSRNGAGIGSGIKSAYAFDRCAGDAAHLVHRQPFGQAVSRQDPAVDVGTGVHLADPLHAGTREFPAARVPLRLAGKKDRFAAVELVDHPGLVEPHAAHVGSVAFQKHGDQGAAVSRRAAINIDDRSRHGLQLARAQSGRGTDVGQIEHVAGEVPQQVLDRHDSQVRQQPGPLRPDAADKLDTDILSGSSFMTMCAG